MKLGWRGGLGVLVPPGNPTVEQEFHRMCPPGVSLHFARLCAPGYTGVPGAAAGIAERVQGYLDTLDGVVHSLGAVRPAVIVLAHTASSYLVGRDREQALVDRLAAPGGTVGLTAARAIDAALRHLKVRRLALATPYPAAIAEAARVYWQAAGFEIVNHLRPDVDNIYEQDEERARQIIRQAFVPDADAVLVSGTGLPTVGALDGAEAELGRPVISSNQASLWNALRIAQMEPVIHGFGRLLREP